MYCGAFSQAAGPPPAELLDAAAPPAPEPAAAPEPPWPPTEPPAAPPPDVPACVCSSVSSPSQAQTADARRTQAHRRPCAIERRRHGLEVPVGVLG